MQKNTKLKTMEDRQAQHAMGIYTLMNALENMDVAIRVLAARLDMQSEVEAAVIEHQKRKAENGK